MAWGRCSSGLQRTRAGAIDANLDRVRLFDLAAGEDVVPPAAVPLDTGHNYAVDLHVDGPRDVRITALP